MDAVVTGNVSGPSEQARLRLEARANAFAPHRRLLARMITSIG
jgi:hypothetical protein